MWYGFLLLVCLGFLGSFDYVAIRGYINTRKDPGIAKYVALFFSFALSLTVWFFVLKIIQSFFGVQ